MGYPTAKITAAKIREFLEVNEPEVIIECPSCQTRFRIEASKLSAQSASPIGDTAASGSSRAKARFHCSRCDYIFSAEVATNNMGDKDLKDNFDKQATNNSEEKILTSQDSGVDAASSATEEAPPQTVSDISTSEHFGEIEAADSEPLSERQSEQLAFNFDSPAIDSSNDIRNHSDPENDYSTTDFLVSSASPSTSEVEATRVVDDDTPFRIPDFSRQDVVDIAKSEAEESNFENLETQANWAKPDSETNASNEDFSRYAQDFGSYSTESSDSFDSASATSSTKLSASANQNGETKELHQPRHTAINSYYQPSASIAGLTPEIYAAESGSKQKMSSLSTIVVLTLPLIICLSLLAATTLYLRNNLKTSEQLLTSLFPKAARETPSGVFIQQPKLETVVLDSGDVVNVVTGTVVNQSKKTLTALTIEGLGFSDSGKIITTERIIAGNPISSNNATIKTLTPSNIKELQSKEPKGFILRPDTKMKFTLVFTRPVKSGGEDSNVASFATRVYSSRFRTE